MKKLRQHLSQNARDRCCIRVDATGEAVVEMNSNEVGFDLETVFDAQYERIARVIAGILRDPARAEELAVEVFLKWSRNPKAHGEKAEGWLYRTAVRTSLNELRRQTRRNRYEAMFGFASAHKTGGLPTPEEIRAAKEEQERVRLVLSVIGRRHSELLLLRSNDFTYEELASTLDLNPASVGTLLSRAQQAFRKEYIKRYGRQ